MGDLDNSYKKFFSFPEMVKGLLEGFVKEDWVAQLDLESLEKANAHYPTDDIRDREDDIIWRVRWGYDWLYIYLLLEFQSTRDPWMPVRIMTYIGLMYQDLIVAEKLGHTDRLPPILPVALYHGKCKWNRATSIDPLIMPAPGKLKCYRPQQQYLLIDKNDYNKEDLSAINSLVSALFALENAEKRQDFIPLIRSLIDWLKTPEQAGLRRAFAIWLRRVLLPRKLPNNEDISLTDLHEVMDMLTRYEVWTEEARQEGLQEGKVEGLQEGRKAGVEATAANMLKMGLDISLISEATGLSAIDIDRIQKSLAS